MEPHKREIKEAGAQPGSPDLLAHKPSQSTPVGYALPDCYVELVGVYNTRESFAGFLASVRFAQEILILGKDYAS